MQPNEKSAIMRAAMKTGRDPEKAATYLAEEVTVSSDKFPTIMQNPKAMLWGQTRKLRRAGGEGHAHARKDFDDHLAERR
jgi:hypothetical protein